MDNGGQKWMENGPNGVDYRKTPFLTQVAIIIVHSVANKSELELSLLEISKSMDEIVEYSEIIDSPVIIDFKSLEGCIWCEQRYSSDSGL